MISVIDQFIQSEAWDHRHSLPLVPKHNNPFIYFAYAYKLILKYNREEGYGLGPQFNLYINKCEKEPGLFYRWPDKSGGPTSHDELMGIAYVSQTHARQILKYLRTNFGCYDNRTQYKRFRFFRFNLYRIPWFIVFLKACAGNKLSYFDKAIFSSFLFFDAFFHSSGDEGGRLRIWLMLDVMKVHVPEACRYWRNKMLEKEIFLPDCFEKYFPTIPVFGNLSQFF